MLPEGVRSLAEIEKYSESRDRTIHCAGLLEHLLRVITPSASFLNFDRLLDRHRGKFSNFRQIDEARKVRNKLVHADARLTPGQALAAESALYQAIQDILPHCPVALQRDVTRSPQPAAPKAPPQREPVPPEPPPISSPPIARPPVPATSPAPASEGPAVGRPAATVWFIAGGAFLLVALFAYAVGARRPDQQTAAATAQPAAPVVSAPPRFDGEHGPPTPPRPRKPTPLEDFRSLINTRLSTSPSAINVAILIDAPGADARVVDAIQGSIGNSKLRLLFNLADVGRLKAGGFFDAMYAGSHEYLGEAAKLSHVNYMLLAKAAHSFRRQPELDESLRTCDMNLVCRLVDHTGTTVRSVSLEATGPGFTEGQALTRAAENIAEQLKNQLLRALE